MRGDEELAGGGAAFEHAALTVKSEEKRDGKVVGIAIRKVSADGKVMTITDDGTNRKGEKLSQVLVFDRQ